MKLQMSGESKTNAMRLLDSAGVAYRVLSFPAGEDHMDALEVAAIIGVEPERVFKTLVATDGAAYFVFCIPAPCSLDLKRAAAVTGAKRIELIDHRLLPSVTGYVRGGCSPLCMKKALPTWIDETAQLHAEISVSAGRRGTQIALAPEELRRLAGAEWADLGR
jgi:Cys-tRNA(Pro)/Cys-tRNA(Cys) deacylase